MTAPTPETMSPREKVARALSPKCWEFYDRHVDDPRMAAEIKHEVATSLQAADAILTALASGSGDHAELARLAEAATAHLAGPKLNADGFGLQIWGDSLKGGSTHVLDVRGWGYLTGGGHGALGLTEEEGIAAQRAIQAYAVAAWNAAPALLAENAALRAERDGMIEEVSRSQARLHAATEAERKLAEAVGLLRQSVVIFHPDSGVSKNISTFLSKEAERG